MAYRRRYRRRSSRRKALSNRTVYGKTGAKSQARQIATLRNRLNYFARRNRPELKTKFSGSSTFTFDNDSTSNTWKVYPGIQPAVGTNNDQRIGDYIKVKSLTWYFTFEYFHNTPGTVAPPDSFGGMIRVIILQYKKPIGTTSVPNSRGAVLEDWSDSGSSYTHQSIVPLKTGITEEFRVLADRKYTITNDKNQLIKKITVKPSNYRYTKSGEVNNVVCMIITSGLHYDTTYTQYIKGTFSDKIVYTDA